MNLHYNFNDESGPLTYFTGNSTLDFDGADLNFEKTATGWSAGGFLLTDPITLTEETEIELKFSPSTNRVGNPNTDGSVTFYTIGVILDTDGSALSSQTYGIYVEGGTIKLQNGPTSGNFGAPELGKSYTLKLKPNANSELEVVLRGPGLTSNDPIGSLSGPFLNRSARLQFNCYSIDTVSFKNLMIKA